MPTSTTKSGDSLMEDLLGPKDRKRSDSGGHTFYQRGGSGRSQASSNPYFSHGHGGQRRGRYGCSWGWGSLVVFLVLVPLMMFLIGVIIDTILFNISVHYNAKAMTISAYALAPFWLLFGNWPRHTRMKNAAASSRLAFDISAHLVFLACLMTYIFSLSTMQRDSFLLNKQVKNVWKLDDISSTVTSIDDIWTYLDTTAATAMYPSPNQKCFGGFEAKVLPGYNLPANDPASTIGCQMFGWETGMPGIASLGPQLRQIRVQSTENNPFYGTGTNNAGAPAPPSYRFFPSLDVGGVSTVAYGPLVADIPPAAAANQNSLNALVQRELASTGCSYACTVASNWTDVDCEAFVWPIMNTSHFELVRAFVYNDGKYGAVAHGGSRIDPITVQRADHTSYLPNGGFVYVPSQLSAVLVNPQAYWRNQLTKLRQSDWIDRSTRALVLSQAFIAVDLLKWQFLTVKFEVAASGYVTSSSSLRIGNFNPSIADFSSSFNVNLDDWNMAYIVFSFAFFFVGTFIMRVVEARSVLHVLSTATVEMDIVVYALVIWAWVIKVMSIYYWPKFEAVDFGVNATCTDHVSQQAETLYSTTFFWIFTRDLFGAVVIVAWLRLVGYLALFPTVGAIPRAVIRALGQIGLFLVTLVIIVWAFTAGFTVTYSANVDAFSTPLQSLQTLWGSMLGNIDISEYIDSDFTVGLPLYITFTFLMLFVFLTFMVSVIDASYDAVKDNDTEIADLVDNEEAEILALARDGAVGKDGVAIDAEFKLMGQAVPDWLWRWCRLLILQHEHRYAKTVGDAGDTAVADSFSENLDRTNSPMSARSSTAENDGVGYTANPTFSVQ